MSEEAVVTIGVLSNATGIHPNTLRTWERRYGLPASSRTEGGHRVYARGEIARLKLVKRVMDRGQRARQVLPLTRSELRKLLGVTDRVESRNDELFDAARALDAGAFDRTLQLELHRRPLLEFFEAIVVPFIRDVGIAWREGRIRIYQEHFATDRMAAFLSSRWSGAQSTDPPVVFGILPGEEHVLGLYMAACLASASGWRPVVLTSACEPVEMLDCVGQLSAKYLFVSIAGYAAKDARGHVESLMSGMPAGSTLVVGGSGGPEIEGLVRFTDLRTYAEWLPPAV